jgi:hypothetical protein
MSSPSFASTNTAFEILINGQHQETVFTLDEALQRFGWYTENKTGYIVLNVRSIVTLQTKMVL